MVIVQFLNFWYPESLKTFIRVLVNSLSVLEEDLAVFLMARLLFVPLFHDSSVIGRGLSFLFRLFRLILGLTAFLIVILAYLSAAFIWFITPIFTLVLAYSVIFDIVLPQSINVLIFNPYNIVKIAPFIFLFGIALFVNYLILRPLKKVWQVKVPNQVWKATKLNPRRDINFQKLSNSQEVENLKKSLEIDHLKFNDPGIQISDETLTEVLTLAKNCQAKYITESYFWLAMLKSIPNIENELMKFDLTISDFEKALKFQENKRNHWRIAFVWDDDFSVKHLKGINRGWIGIPTPTLDSFSEDLTKKALKEKIPEFKGRMATVNEVINVLSQEADRNVLVVGETGVGKTALVEFLAKKIVSGDAPASLAIKRLVNINLTEFVSNATAEGIIAKKVKEVFTEIEQADQIIIFIDDIHTLGMGDLSDRYNLYSLILPYLESDKFQFIGATDPENYARIIEKDREFARIFHKVELESASFEETLDILEERAIALAKSKKIETSFLAIKEIASRAQDLFHNRVLPDSAISLFEEVIPAANGFIKADLIKELVSKKLNIPLKELDRASTDLLLNLEEKIHQRLIDQEDAVKKVSDTLRRAGASIREKTRPIGSFLFVGPTGVGKTELAKVLAEIYFKSHQAFLRFDMSEYQTTQSIERLIGNFEKPGELTEAVKSRPYCLILLDEFEKADPKILNLFLQVLEDSRLTGADSKTIDFTNTIIIATSNAASIIIAQGLDKGQNLGNLQAQIRAELLKVFKPELLNRFDEVVIFKPLSENDLKSLVKLKLTGLKEIIKKQGYLVEFSEDLISGLSKQGYDKTSGARALRRIIREKIEAKISRMILENKLKKGEVFTANSEFLSPPDS